MDKFSKNLELACKNLHNIKLKYPVDSPIRAQNTLNTFKGEKYKSLADLWSFLSKQMVIIVEKALTIYDNQHS